MAEIKGVLLSSWMVFLKERYGDQAITDSLKRLSAEDRFLLSAPFLPSTWYKYETLYALRRLMQPMVKPAERNLSVELGRFMAEYVFTGVYRSFLVKDPAKQLKKFSWIKDFFFQEARKLETDIISESRYLVRYTYEPGAKPTRAICESLTGFWSRTLELSGVSKVKTAHPVCVARGANCCEFLFDLEQSAVSPSRR
ncbi:MAG TPA: hypothetical protein VKA70_16460 [Blastocatellia bacterium]|nr:hypothetical protein [Blastocatellia bacterium]